MLKTTCCCSPGYWDQSRQPLHLPKCRTTMTQRSLCRLIPVI